jgi:hypothetical protein
MALRRVGDAAEIHLDRDPSLSLGRAAPHRPVPHAFEEIFSRPCVAAWDRAKIIDWYLAQ